MQKLQAQIEKGEKLLYYCFDDIKDIIAFRDKYIRFNQKVQDIYFRNPDVNLLQLPDIEGFPLRNELNLLFVQKHFIRHSEFSARLYMLTNTTRPDKTPKKRQLDTDDSIKFNEQDVNRGDMHESTYNYFLKLLQTYPKLSEILSTNAPRYLTTTNTNISIDTMPKIGRSGHYDAINFVGTFGENKYWETIEFEQIRTMNGEYYYQDIANALLRTVKLKMQSLPSEVEKKKLRFTEREMGVFSMDRALIGLQKNPLHGKAEGATEYITENKKVFAHFPKPKKNDKVLLIGINFNYLVGQDIDKMIYSAILIVQVIRLLEKSDIKIGIFTGGHTEAPITGYTVWLKKPYERLNVTMLLKCMATLYFSRYTLANVTLALAHLNNYDVHGSAPYYQIGNNIFLGDLYGRYPFHPEYPEAYSMMFSTTKYVPLVALRELQTMLQNTTNDTANIIRFAYFKKSYYEDIVNELLKEVIHAAYPDTPEKAEHTLMQCAKNLARQLDITV